MFEAQVVHHQGRDQPQDHQPPADEFVRTDRLDEDRQGGDQDDVDRLRDQPPEQVFAELEVEVALDRLDDHGDHDRDREGRDQHQGNGQGLGRDEGPVGGGGGVDDLVGPPFALPPDQFAGVVDGDDHAHGREDPAERGDHHPRHRIGAPAIEADLGHQPQVDDRQQGRERQQHEIGRALEHLAHFETGAGPELGAGGGGVEHRLRQRAAERARRVRGLGLDGEPGRPALVARDLAGLEVEEAVGEAQEAEADRQPQELVPQHIALDRRDQGVALAGGPVAGRQAEGGDAVGLPERGGGLHPLAVQHQAEDRAQDDEAHDAHIGPHHRAGDGGQREEDRRRQEQHRQRQVEIGEEVGSGQERAEGFAIHPGHQRAQPEAQRDGDERQGRSEVGPGEAAVEVVELADPGGIDQRAVAGVVVADHHVGHEGGGHEHVDDREDQARLGDHPRRVLVDVGGVAELDVVRRHRAEGQQHEEDRGHPEDRLARLVAELEARDLEEHCLRPPCGRTPEWRSRRLPDRR